MTWNPLSRRFPAVMRWSFVAIMIVTMTVQIMAIRGFLNDREFLSDLADRIADPSSPPSEQIKQMVRFMRELPAVPNNSYLVLPVFKPLRPTARQVVEKGGDCADRSRLLVRLAELRGIDGSKWALYSADQQPRHAVVEVQTESGPMVVDPLFGLWFPRTDDGYYGIEELQDDESILLDRIGQLMDLGEQPGANKLEYYPVDLYTYAHARTINWDKSIFMRSAYRVTRTMVGDRVRTLARPTIVEKPALMLFWALVLLQLGTYLFWVVAGNLMARREHPEVAPSGRGHD